MEKKPYLAAAVQTVEALEVCIEERLGLFCIEEPLYSQMKAVPAMNEIKNFDIQCYEEKRIAVVKRIRGGKMHFVTMTTRWYIFRCNTMRL